MQRLSTKLPPIRVKCVTVGDCGVGKTCLLIRQCHGTYPHEYVPTEFDHHVHNIKIDETNVEVETVDARGSQDDYIRLRPLCYPGTDVFIICFDLSNPISFENVKKLWYPELKEHCPEPPIILLGTKLDLKEDMDGNPTVRDDEIQIISNEQGQEMKSKIGALQYFECSALTGKGVNHVFYEAVCHALAFYFQMKKNRSCNLL